ncbi:MULTISPECIES: VOC family protein [Chryseobacterium]|uniref:VOC family protein n=1 Tax=Chryseobacterium caseinilyticum TaxID=2771428 RepID=A0ABR8Z8S3_9FLAO|nr:MULTISPECIES: VOC family protein [Chryseobacterium]KQS92127.1 glyoxalase [Chryseobacterium sp. Leaf394]MBD8081176.1 VOC family protein [Chryseobacterium caseinilyticum]
MTKFNALRPVLWTDHFEETISFYTQILGFSLNEKNENWQWASLQKDDVVLMISKKNDHSKSNNIGFSGSFYFNINDVEILWSDLKEKADVCYEIETFEWGMREFAIYDNNGYILQFGENVSEISKEP